MTAHWDNTGSDVGADTVKISETSTAVNADAYDIDPDTENYAAGLDPDVAYRNQGRADSPNGWSSQAQVDSHPDNHGHESYAEGTGEDDESHEGDSNDETPDLWGDTDPDAANYADLDGHDTSNPDGQQDGIHEDKPAPEGAPDADTAKDRQADEHAERVTSPKQERIDALEAENAAAREQLADARQQITDSNQRISDLEAKNSEQAAQASEQSARMDRFEQVLTEFQQHRDAGTSGPEHGDDKAATSADRPEAQDKAKPKYGAEIAEHQNSSEGRDEKDSRHNGWRRAVSSESLGLIGALGGAAQAAGDLAVHASPDGMIGLGLTALGVAQILKARAEKKAERKGKP